MTRQRMLGAFGSILQINQDSNTELLLLATLLCRRVDSVCITFVVVTFSRLFSNPFNGLDYTDKVRKPLLPRTALSILKGRLVSRRPRRVGVHGNRRRESCGQADRALCSGCRKHHRDRRGTVRCVLNPA